MIPTVPTILQTIAKSVELRLNARKALIPRSLLETSIEFGRIPRDFARVFSTPHTHVIAEVKFRSPALGVLEQAGPNEAVQTATEYVKAGTTAISILTEADHFHGSHSYLTAVRVAHPEALLLMKDFVIDEYQLLEARMTGADAALLIVSLLGEDRTRDLHTFARSIGLSTLVEVHDEAEMESAIRIGSNLIGVNNRDLKTLEISLDTSVRLAPLIPKDTVVISESGIQSRSEIQMLESLGYRGFLVGGVLMQSTDPAHALKILMGQTP